MKNIDKVLNENKNNPIMQLCKALLNCGDDDLKYLIDEADSFQVDLYDAVNFAKEIVGELDFNNVIEAVYTLAVQDVNPNAIIGDDYEIHTNYLDSDLTVRTEDDWEEVFDKEELRQKLQVTNYDEENEESEPLDESVEEITMDQFYTNMLK